MNVNFVAKTALLIGTDSNRALGDVLVIGFLLSPKSLHSRKERLKMSDLIDRQAAIDAINRAVTKEAARWSVEELPSAQPERKKGEWIPAFDGKFTGGAYWFSCSNCKRIVPDVRNGGWNYCPNCGADMRGEQDDS